MPAAKTAPARKPRHFPPLDARSLAGVECRLPDAFAAGRNVVLVGWARSHQALAERWLPSLHALRARTPDLGLHGVLALAPATRHVRSVLVRILRSYVPDPATRDALYLVHADPMLIAAALGLSEDPSLCVLAVGPGGTIAWQHAGAYSVTAEAQLVAALDAMA
jgi:hypothetical protein